MGQEGEEQLYNILALLFALWGEVVEYFEDPMSDHYFVIWELVTESIHEWWDCLIELICSDASAGDKIVHESERGEGDFEVGVVHERAESLGNVDYVLGEVFIGVLQFFVQSMF